MRTDRAPFEYRYLSGRLLAELFAACDTEPQLGSTFVTAGGARSLDETQPTSRQHAALAADPYRGSAAGQAGQVMRSPKAIVKQIFDSVKSGSVCRLNQCKRFGRSANGLGPKL